MNSNRTCGAYLLFHRDILDLTHRHNGNYPASRLMASQHFIRGCTRLADMLPSKYEDNTLQIKEKVQKELLRFFVLEVTARSAADLLGIQLNSAILFYRKIHIVSSAIIWP